MWQASRPERPAFSGRVKVAFDVDLLFFVWQASRPGRPVFWGASRYFVDRIITTFRVASVKAWETGLLGRVRSLLDLNILFFVV